MRTRTFWYIALPMLVVVALIANPAPAVAQATTTGIDCSQIAARHLLQQDNQRAGLTLMECGVIPRPHGTAGNSVEEPAQQPPNVLVSNRSCTSGSSCTKSESNAWHSAKAGDNTVVVTYNDSNGLGTDYSGLSYSLDGGATFTEVLPPPLGTGHGTNYGDPIVLYNLKLQKWFAGDLVTGCGGLGIGVWTSPDGINWTVGACAHSGNDDDRESFWVDNNAFSAVYGRMYVSFNNFAVDGGALSLTHSDDGVTWSTPVLLASTFVRDVQVTGAPPGPPPPNVRYFSTVIVAGMDEGGGGLATRQNIIYRSIDGGVTWTNTVTGPRFNAAGDGTCPSNSYFAKMNPIIRHMGWGEPAVGPNGVVHYAYAGKGSLSTGDIYYVRSTDNGNTWSTPIVLNDPETNQFQSHWMPSVSVNYNLAAFTPPQDVTVSWYDRRNATSACNVATDPGCSYYRYGIQSSDNGNTWGSNIQVSDQLIPMPTQDDGTVQPCYAGDYDYNTALGGTAYITWTDGRVSVGGVAVQNVELEALPEP